MPDITCIDSSPRIVLQRNPFSASADLIACGRGATIEDAVDAANVPEVYRDMIEVDLGGVVVPRSHWRKVRPRDGAVVYIRVVPQGGQSPLRVVAMIALVAVAVYTGGVIGPQVASAIGVTSAAGVAAVTAAVTAVTVTAGTLLLNAVIPPPGLQPQQQDSLSAAPSYALTGSSNRMVPFASIPRVMGKRRLYPMLAAKPYTESQGDKQFIRMLLIAGYGPLRITDLKIGETAIGSFDNVEVQISEGGPDGWAGNQTLTLYTQTVLQEDLSVELGTANPTHTATTELDTAEISVDITCPGGMYKYGNDGSYQNVDARFIVEYAPIAANGTVGTFVRASWAAGSDDGFGANGAVTIDEKTTRTVRRSGRFTPVGGYADKRWRVRITRENGNLSDSKGNDRTFWSALRSIRHESPVNISGVCLIALRIKASEQLNGVPDSINCVAESYLPVYNGASWSYQITRHPAWAFADILRRRGTETVLADSRLDLPALQDWAASDHQYDAVLEGGSIFEALKAIASHGRATLSIRDGRFTAVQDKPRSYPVQHITPRNSFNYVGNRNFVEVPHGIRVRYINADAGYAEDEVIAYADGYTAANATKIETLEFYGLTSAGAAWRAGRYYLATLLLRPEEHVVEMDIENLRCTIGDQVRFTHDAVSIGSGSGRIKSTTVLGNGTVSQAVLDQPIDVPLNQRLALRVRAPAAVAAASQISLWEVVAATSSPIQTVTFAGTLPSASLVAPGALFALGVLNAETAAMIVKRIEPGANLTAKLTLVDDQSGIYTSATEPIPPFDPNITIQVPLTQQAPVAPTFVLRSDESALMVLADGTLQDQIMVSVDPPGYSPVRIASFDVQFRDTGSGEWATAGQLLENNRVLAIPGVVQGRSYDVRVRSVSQFGVSSDWVVVSAHQVVGKTTRPSNVGSLTATIDPQLGVTLSWSAVGDRDLSYYDIRSGANWDTGTVVAQVKGLSHRVGLLPVGSVTYWVKAVDAIGLTSLTAATVTATVVQPPSPVVAAAIDADQAVISWAQAAETLRITNYEVAYGATLQGAAVLGSSKTTVFRTTANWTGSRRFWVTAIDVAGNRSQAASVDLVVNAPLTPSIQSVIDGPDVVLSWTDPVASLSIAQYEIRTGASFAAGTLLTQLKANSYRARVNFPGNQNFWIAAVDAGGNYGPAGQAQVTITGPGAVTITPQVIDNNVLLRWTAPSTGTLPVETYQVKRGATFAGGTLIGTLNGRFSAIFETAAGAYTYWVAAVDTAGNVGTAAPITVQVSEPPDFELKLDQDLNLSATIANFAIEGDTIAGPLNTAETYESHFTSRGWASPQAQIDAGYPYWVQPTATSASYTREVDYGALIPSTRILVTVTSETAFGSVTITPTISVRASSGDAWTDYTGQNDVFVTNVRYIKVALALSSAGGDDLTVIDRINLRVEVKLKSDAGRGTANAADVGGTTVLFNKSFVDITSITVTPSGTLPRTAIYDFADVLNPTSFKVLLFDSNGNRVSGDFSWTAIGA